jgi:hypothetical protein
MSKEKLLMYLVIVLVLINAIILSFLLLNKQNPAPRKQEVFQLIQHELLLEEKQIEEFEKLRHTHREQMNALDKKFKETLITYFSLLRDSNKELFNQDSLENVLAAIEKEKATITLNHFKKVKTILHKDQRVKFDELIPELITVMSSKNSPPPPHPPRRD